MHLGIYRFEGNPDELLPAYDSLMQSMPPGKISWHLCTVVPDGIVIYDTCPSEEAFVAFSTGAGFRGALAQVGLPEPTVTGQPVHNARP